MMKTFFSKTVLITSFIMITTLLNSCQDKIEEHQTQVVKSEETDKNNGSYTTALDYDTQQLARVKAVHSNALCPWCRQGYRYFYKLAIAGDCPIILICEECEGMCLNPDNLNIGICDEGLKEHFHIEDADMLFEGSDWATREEVSASIWKNYENCFLIKDS